MLLWHLQLAAAEVQHKVVEHAARAAAEQAAVCAAAAQAVCTELASMHSTAQSEATALNEAEIVHFAKNVQFWAVCIACTHDNTCVLVSLKCWLQHGTMDCTCSHVMLHDSAMDMHNEDMRQALAQVHTNLLSEQAHHDAEQGLLMSEQCQQERWCCESPSSDMLYELLADTWPYLLVQPVDTAVSTTVQVR